MFPVLVNTVFDIGLFGREDNSKCRRGSNIRSGSLPGGKFTGPRNNSKKGVRNPSKSLERPKSELFKKVETLEKDMKEIKEML